MPNYWVVSANLNPRTRHLELWERIVREEHRAFMGWGDDNPIGRRFATEMDINDAILIASCSNANKRLCACGRVATGPIPARDLDLSADYGAWARDPSALKYSFSRWLEPFRELEPAPQRYGLRFEGGKKRVTWGRAHQVPALYQLSPDTHSGDRAICEWLDRMIAGRPALDKPGALARRLRASSKKTARGVGPGTAGLTPEQISQGLRGEEYVLRLLQRRKGLEGLRFKEDCRRRPCGYDFLCSDSDGADIRVEVKTFADNGRIFLTENEWKEASVKPASHCLIGVLAEGNDHLKIAAVLRSPYNTLLRAEPVLLASVQYMMPARQIFPDARGGGNGSR